MATNASLVPARRKTGGRSTSLTNDTLRRKALEKLTLAIVKAVESASDDTLADIVGTSDLRHALAIAPRDIAPESPADLEAIMAAREKTVRFREDMAARAGGMLDRADVAAMFGVTPAAIDKQRQRRQILGVPYGAEMRYPAAQFVDGEVLQGLKAVLEAFDDMNPWEQLMMLTTPLEGFGAQPETILQTLTRRPEPRVLKQLAALAASWAA
ncbi:hypothetical protein PX699_22715 [Sphingobium sp. H39-3-25]|uniref:hypothetical protein n=1 Tax=Sphingomonadales TaxID=204457 RepID=UPI0008325D91|nr:MULTISPECIES: hypothetical protein [Sphingomonadaceae]MDF0491099.1 hypothetical protein [Sphingomonas pollutisoli]MDF0545170.1 hypothetical protein [Sphingobium arseniciresistens]